MKTPSDGTRRTADSTAHAAFHADLKAWVSSLDPFPTAPKDLTLNTLHEPELELESLEYSSLGDGGSAGDGAGGWEIWLMW